jgi:hypothetical protein
LAGRRPDRDRPAHCGEAILQIGEARAVWGRRKIESDPVVADLEVDTLVLPTVIVALPAPCPCLTAFCNASEHAKYTVVSMSAP